MDPVSSQGASVVEVPPRNGAGFGNPTSPRGEIHPWDGFLVGPENELAFASVQTLARGEREGVSPLVIHGPSGVGKSRLLEGLLVDWVRRHPSSPFAHLGGSEFAAGWLERDESGETAWADLRARFRSVELFVLEDVEGLERAPLARGELVHTLDALEAAGARIAISARTAPGQWARPAWPTRLVNRLMGGLAVRIDPPGLTSRRRYLLDRARACALSLPAEAVEALAEAADGYRTLDGWLARLTLQTNVDRRASSVRGNLRGKLPCGLLDLATVNSALCEETDLAVAGLTIEAVARAVGARFGVRLSSLRGPGRQASIAEARHLAMYLARLHTDCSFAVIGAYFGGRDPATVRHACKAAATRLAADPSLAAAVAALGMARTSNE